MQRRGVLVIWGLARGRSTLTATCVAVYCQSFRISGHIPLLNPLLRWNSGRSRSGEMQIH
eukprot:4432594-Pyramimonas_sp.AAC.1